MKHKRRDFLKLTSLASAGFVGTSFLTGCSNPDSQAGKQDDIVKLASRERAQKFNMSGYGAEPIPTVRIGFVGLGNRGPGAVRRMSYLEGVEIKALCDIRPEKAEAAAKILEGTTHQPELYTAGEDDWKNMCDRDDIDLIYIATPWSLHTPMAVYAMEQGKHAATEVPAATTLEECWQLVETSEKTRKHCVILENCCYDFFELLTLNMARQGFFGEVMHGEGAYIHDILEGSFSKSKNYNNWRLRQNMHRNGNLYPTHGLGPVCQIMNINRGDRMDYLTSTSTSDFMMGKMADSLAENDDYYKEFAGQDFRGNLNTSVVKTEHGKTIMIQHDTSSPRPYSRIHLISGTKGVARKYPLPGKIANSHKGWFSEEEMKAAEEKYTPEMVTLLGDMARKAGGHGGMDFLMDWRLIDCLRNGLPMDHDVYDAALWSSIFPLSEWSTANRSATIDVPDFTGGSWKRNNPVDISLKNGVSTKIAIPG
ncbi:Gfo/Idh/MocA family oxidoreductase [Membranicola marinus]|uniref:Gfo/Idh/MocA family oxidoreductase n=1 Tax=Membranihabitans marinus TaxID=1227546 RepID=A0A953HVP7_9BACT|nr:Gfo/Idh/MocA family oxidoreductase [Membranihabitans marinus]MBY5958698.1 Gfo/Idh/MocA family oxidoreductase [Membranihabitans marinus]